MNLPMISCQKLLAFAETNLDDARAAFQSAPALPLAQSWLPQPEADFLPGRVRIGWRDETMFALAELNDADIFTRATRLNEYTWELGDAFEIFLKPVEQEAYVEFHITPNNQRLQLRVPGTAALRAAQRSGLFGAFLIGGDAIRSHTWVRAEARLWFALAAIPATTVWGAVQPMAGAEWRFSFSRYDYTRGRAKPVLSSTSLHPKPDFHSQTEWGTIRFEP